MSITGTESILSANWQAQIKTNLEAAVGETFLESTFLEAVCDALADILIPHLVNNITVKNAGETTTIPIHAPGGATIGTLDNNTVIT